MGSSLPSASAVHNLFDCCICSGVLTPACDLAKHVALFVFADSTGNKKLVLSRTPKPKGTYQVLSFSVDLVDIL